MAPYTKHLLQFFFLTGLKPKIATGSPNKVSRSHLARQLAVFIDDFKKDLDNWLEGEAILGGVMLRNRPIALDKWFDFSRYNSLEGEITRKDHHIDARRIARLREVLTVNNVIPANFRTSGEGHMGSIFLGADQKNREILFRVAQQEASMYAYHTKPINGESPRNEAQPCITFSIVAQILRQSPLL